MRLSSIIFLSFAALITASALIIPLSLPKREHIQFLDQKSTLPEGSAVRGIIVDANNARLNVSVDSAATAPKISIRRLKHIDDIETIYTFDSENGILTFKYDTDDGYYTNISITLPPTNDALAMIKATDPTTDITISGVYSPALAISPLPHEVTIENSGIDSLILGRHDREKDVYTGVHLYDSEVDVIATKSALRDINLSLGGTSIGTLRQL